MRENGVGADRSVPSSSSSPSPSPSSSSQLLSLLKGRWSLVYSSAQPFRSSPFFWGFSKALGNVAAAEAVFAFTDALPFARIGTARQEVKQNGKPSPDDSDSPDSYPSSKLLWITSDVGLTVAGASGRVVTESSVSVVEESGSGTRGGGEDENDDDGKDDDVEDDLSPLLTLSIRPVSTRVEGSALLPRPLGKARVPVGEALDAVAGFTGRVLSSGTKSGGSGDGGKKSDDASPCATLLEITYLDEQMRIGRTPWDGHLFVYAREEE